MALNTKTLAQLVQDQAAAIQSRAIQIVDFTTGSVMRSFTEANAAVGLWLQGLALKILSMTRLSTSTGSDVDSWVNDWGIGRLSATLSLGSVTFSRFTPQSAAVIPVGAQIQTADGTQSYQVIADATNANWSGPNLGYILPIGVTSITVPVQSMTGALSANVAANTVSVMITNIIGVDTVTNALALTGGSNAETDAQLRQRFIYFIGSLSKGTVAAIQYAITSLQLGLKCTVIENYASDGTFVQGLLTITVDDGSGAPPQSLLSTVSANVASVRAASINWVVLPPVIVNANVFCVITTGTGYDHNTVVAQVAAALTNFMVTLGVGDGLPYLRLSQIIYDASPGVTAIQSFSLNGLLQDILGNPRNVIKLQSLTVS